MSRNAQNRAPIHADPSEPGSKPKRASGRGNKSPGKADLGFRGQGPYGLRGAIGPTPIGAGGSPPEQTPGAGPDAAADTTAALERSIPKGQLSGLADLGAEPIGEATSRLFGLIAEFRGEHWRVEPEKCASAIGDPIKRWLDHQDRSDVKRYAKAAGNFEIIYNLIELALPIAIGEYFRYLEAKQARDAQGHPQPQPDSPRSGAAPAAESRDRRPDIPGYPQGTSDIYSGSFNFATAGISPARDEAPAAAVPANGAGGSA